MVVVVIVVLVAMLLVMIVLVAVVLVVLFLGVLGDLVVLVALVLFAVLFAVVVTHSCRRHVTPIALPVVCFSIGLQKREVRLAPSPASSLSPNSTDVSGPLPPTLAAHLKVDGFQTRHRC